MEYRSQETNKLDLFTADPGLYIENAVKDFVRTSPLNCLVEFQNKPFFGVPVLSFADGDSPIFKNFKQNVSESHLLPREILEKQIPIPFRMKPGFELKHVTVIAGALPVNPEIIRAEAESQHGSSLIHNHMNWLGGHWGFLKAVCDYIETQFYIMGHSAVAPFFSPLYKDEPQKMAENCRKIVCNWSERHVAEACGLGTFGLNGMIITEKGIAVNLFSIVCDVEIASTPRPDQEYCLYYRNGSCGECIERCQNSAITEEGRDPRKCHDYVAKILPEIFKREGKLEGIVGLPSCGLCTMGVPCSERIP